MIKYPSELNTIFYTLIQQNIKPIIVGGFIRDSLLHIDSKDIDIELYNLSSFDELENILKKFGNINSVGKSFGISKLRYKNLDLDFSLPRQDSKIKSGHRGFKIKTYSHIDFKTATSRRDFTINSIGYDIVDKKILDPFNGINDLKNKRLKMVNADTFVEDPLRVLRAVQFCARFDLEMDEELFLLCFKMVEQNMLEELPKERIYEEIKKLLLKSKKPSIGFELLKKIGALKYFLQCSDSMSALNNLAKQLTTNSKTNEILMLASLCYNFNSTQIEDFISNLSNDKELLRRVLILVENLNIVTSLYSDYDLYKLSTKVNIEELVILSKAVYGIGDKVAARAKELNILNKKMPAILMGRDLIKYGMKPSSKFTKILNAAYEAQMQKKFSSYDEALVWLKNYTNL